MRKFVAAFFLLYAAGGTAPAQSSSEPARQLIKDFQAQQLLVKSISDVSLSPDGARIAWTVADAGRHTVYVAKLASPATARALVVPATQPCNTEAAAWAPNAHSLAFFSDCASPGQARAVEARGV